MQPQSNLKIAGLIMAAGQASRFGSCKQLATWQGKPLLQYVIDAVNGLPAVDCYVLSGAWHTALQQARAQEIWQGAELLYHKEWAKGLGSSIAQGVNILGDRYDGLFILLADQIAIKSTALEPMLANFDGEHPVCAFYAGKRGVPALFAKAQFPLLGELNGDQGAKTILYRSELQVSEFPLPEAAWDIDTPEQLQQE